MLSPAHLSPPLAHLSEPQRRFAALPHCPCALRHPSPLHGHTAISMTGPTDLPTPIVCAAPGMGGKRPKGVGMSRPNKKKVAVDEAVLEAATTLATAPPPPRTSTTGGGVQP